MFSKKFPTIVCILTLILALCCLTNTSQAGAVTSGLIAYWSFDEDTVKDGTVEDVWGDSDGEIKGEPEITQGKVGKAILLDGDVDCVLVDSEAINIDYSEITMECWVYINALDDSWNRIISLDDTTAGNNNVASLYYDDDDDQHGFFLRANGESCDAAKDMIQEDIPTEEWIHILGTWDGKTVRYYENGELKKSYSLSETIIGGSLFLGIGDRSDGLNEDTVQGLIDEVRIYEKSFSEVEVKQNYTGEGLAVTSSDNLSVTWAKLKMSQGF